MTGDRSAWRNYALYGITLRSDFGFRTALPAGPEAHDLSFTCTRAPPAALAVPASDPVYHVPADDPGEPPLLALEPYQGADGRTGVRMRFADVADYYVGDRCIHCHLRDPAHAYLIEIHLLGYVLALWLERSGRPALHASAVVVEDKAVVFLASNNGGKSSLAAALLEAGFPLLTDDVLPLELQGSRVMGRPGYPQMRLWPDQAAHFLGRFEDLEIVHPAYAKRRVPIGEGGWGRFHRQAVPVGCIVMPELLQNGGDEAITADPVPPREVFKQLLRNSFVGEMVDALGWQSRRLETLARLAGSAPTFRLRYPRALDRLGEVREAVLGIAAGARP